MILSGPSTRTASAPSADAEHGINLARVPLHYWVSAAVAALILVACAAGLFIPGLYHDAPDWIVQTRGTDLVTLSAAVPALVVSVTLSARGSIRAKIVLLGVLGYVLYMYVIYAFDVAFNPLFLVYTASIALSLWSLDDGPRRGEHRI